MADKEIIWLFEVDLGYKTQRILMRGPVTKEHAREVFEHQQNSTNSRGEPFMPQGDYTVRMAEPDDITPPPNELESLKAELDLPEVE